MAAHSPLRTILSCLLALPGVAAVHAESLPIVTVVAVDPNASEAGPHAAVLLLTRDGADVSQPLTVALTYAGSATAGIDFAEPGRSITFLPQSPFASLTITPIVDNVAEGDETVVLRVTPNPLYVIGEQPVATATISDAGGSKQVVPLNAARRALPPPDRKGTLAVTIAFDGSGQWRHPKNGAYSNLKFHRELNYTVPLDGVFSAGSGFSDLDKRDVSAQPDLRRYLIGRPHDAVAPAGTPCGLGTSVVLDEASGLEVGDPGQPALVPFTQTIKGGGTYPSGDKTVPESDLCQTLVSFDNAKHVLSLRFDGTDAHVKVVNTHNGHKAAPYNLRLQGDDADAKAKFTFDVPIPAGASSSEGSKTIENVSVVGGPLKSRVPLTATVRWKVTLK